MLVYEPVTDIKRVYHHPQQVPCVLSTLCVLSGEVPMPACPDWDLLWRLVYESCLPSISATGSAPSVEAACRSVALFSLSWVSFLSQQLSVSASLSVFPSMVLLADDSTVLW